MGIEEDDRAAPREPARGLSPEEVRAIYLRYGYFLRRRCRLLVRDDALADDALQDACIGLLRGGASFRDAKEPLAYLYKVADRAAFDLLRARRRKPLPGAAPEVLEGLDAAPGLDPWLRHAAVTLLEELDDEDRTLALLAFVDGFDQGEIASRLGVSRVTVNKRVGVLRDRAREHLLLEETPR